MNLGDYARDKVTGLAGLVTARSLYLFSGPQVQLQPRGLKQDGSMRDSVWLDEARCEPCTVTDEDLRRQIL